MFTKSLSLFVQTGVTPLYGASEEGHSEVVDTLLKSGSDPNLATMVWEIVVYFPSFTGLLCYSVVIPLTEYYD